MDLQSLVDAIGDADARTRSNYHLTFGDLIDALKAAQPDAPFDARIVGLSSYRGYYTDIALCTDSYGYYASDQEYLGGNYTDWEVTHTMVANDLPSTAKELAAALEQLVGKGFTGYKGGWFKVDRSKALWLAEDDSDCSCTAIVGINPDLSLVTKTTT